MHVHFIAIGGSAMHNLAIALKRRGDVVTGSDDEIFEPSRTRLQKEGILPEKMGWNAEKIAPHLEAVIVGMHARQDNVELLKAQELGLKTYSYPEFLYEQSRHKTRIVIAGSHGKTTITAMILHVAQQLNISLDYMVGAQLDGYDCMVKLSENASMMLLEGDEYLSSPIDLRPKFHLYHPDIALLSGIAWDHVNVFPTLENYIEQFATFVQRVRKQLIYNDEDQIVREISRKNDKIKHIPYATPHYKTTETGTHLFFEGQTYNLQIFGQHNLQNLIGAMKIGECMGIEPSDFLDAITTFKGASQRLEVIVEREDFIFFKDFAHSPSKLRATIDAVREQYPHRKLIACMELHTFSSLQADFLPQYKNTMKQADKAIVYYRPQVVEHKKLPPISKSQVQQGFDSDVMVVNSKDELIACLSAQTWKNSVLLLMSSGNFDRLNYHDLGVL